LDRVCRGDLAGAVVIAARSACPMGSSLCPTPPAHSPQPLRHDAFEAHLAGVRNTTAPSSSVCSLRGEDLPYHSSSIWRACCLVIPLSFMSCWMVCSHVGRGMEFGAGFGVSLDPCRGL